MPGEESKNNMVKCVVKLIVQHAENISIFLHLNTKRKCYYFFMLYNKPIFIFSHKSNKKNFRFLCTIKVKLIYELCFLTLIQCQRYIVYEKSDYQLHNLQDMFVQVYNFYSKHHRFGYSKKKFFFAKTFFFLFKHAILPTIKPAYKTYIYVYIVIVFYLILNRKMYVPIILHICWPIIVKMCLRITCVSISVCILKKKCKPFRRGSIYGFNLLPVQ